MVKKSTFMDNTPFESSGFYEAENCAILPKKNFSKKCMNPIIPDRPKIFIISNLNVAYWDQQLDLSFKGGFMAVSLDEQKAGFEFYYSNGRDAEKIEYETDIQRRQNLSTSFR